MSSPFVTVGVPVYKGEEFIVETLNSIQAQSYKNIEVHISLDGPDPRSEELCQPFLKDSRFHLFVQPERLGWVNHVNWLMSQVKTPYWYCHPHDDLVAPEYVEVLLAEAEKSPEAAVLYCDMSTFGIKKRKFTRSSVAGNPVQRQLQLIYKHHAAVAFRGLTRIEAIHNAGKIRANEVDSYSSDTIWMAAMARWGNLQRVPQVMYYKRYHPNNEHTKWASWSKEKITKAWVIHCVDMLEQAMQVEATHREKEMLWWATLQRLQLRSFRYLQMAKATFRERIKLFEDFFYYARNRGIVEIPSRIAKLEYFIAWMQGLGSK